MRCCPLNRPRVAKHEEQISEDRDEDDVTQNTKKIFFFQTNHHSENNGGMEQGL